MTAAGIDFLADDGGQAAIFGVVSVKFSENILRALIANRLAEADW